MHLRSLELCGFKSFADRTEIVFERGLTAIVGPNGCGKSNIVDAIRWALGEQSARTLRGGAMSDVIFNGGGRRGPLGMAEVTLRFENEDRVLAIERDEVRVTRRLYRSGESEYLLDGKPCRLRDIRELLIDTGAGASAATFVEQGKIDALLHASPEERRHVLEEAAGIGKYKIRRREALERLEEVGRDRSRLADVLKEVTDRHEEVKRQAEKAARYKELRDRHRALRLELVRGKRAALERRAEEARARGSRLALERAALEREAAALAAECDRLAEKKRLEERAIREAELELRDLAGALETCKREAEQEARRAAECRDELAREARAREALEAKARGLEKEIAAGREAAAEQRESEKGLGEKLEALEARSRELEQRARAAQAVLEGEKRELATRLERESQVRNRLAELDARAKVLGGREDRLARKKAEVAAALAEREAEAAALADAAREAAARAKALEAELAAAGRRRDAAEAAIRAAEEAFLEARRALNEVEARIAALAALEREGHDLAPGVRAVLETGGEHVLGTLGDAVACAREHAAAVEAALGPCAQWVLVRTAGAAAALAKWLARAEKGRAHLVAIDGGPPEDAGPRPAGSVADLVRAEPHARALVERLLGGVRVTRDLDEALALSPELRLPCVTLAGELVGAHGIEAGRGAGPGRIERRSERRELEERRDAMAADLDARRAALETLRAAERAAAQAVERLRSAHHEALLASFGAKKEREERERLLARTREEERLTSAELEEVVHDRRDALEGLAVVEEELAQLRAGTASLEARVSESAAALRALDVERATVREELHDLKVRLASGAERWEALRRAAARAERELEETRRSLEALAQDGARTQERLGAARAAADRYMAEARRLIDDRGTREKRLEELRAALEAAAAELSARRAAAAEADEARKRADAAAASAEREERDARVRLEELATRAREELNIELAFLEPAPPEPGFSEASAEREAALLRKKMDEIGPVNLEALEECERLEERRKFLEAQAADLAAADENLRAALRRINETSRKRFLETFEAVRENFKEIFRKLFGGGRADLVLEEGKDVLEAGVDVQARPPGKEARTISLLSGGEKTLATVALLFAVFRTKPGPFCILDEVDAALDEHNVGRFVALVREFLDRSQFLIVSHNKRTMAAADALYGVTMPEPGVSAPVSVRLAGAAEMSTSPELTAA